MTRGVLGSGRHDVPGSTLVPARARFATPARAVLHLVPVLHSDRRDEPQRRALCGARSSGEWVLRPGWPDRQCPLCTEYAADVAPDGES